MRGDAGVVEFVAHHKVNGRAGKLHEVSRFVREDGPWRYVDGETSSGGPDGPPASTVDGSRLQRVAPFVPEGQR